ncbi:MAG: hypothetical protein GXP49_10825 [Deltaproteobacteria bacterium]|nr:hypothetical protein [Deltaproteobacteria bacterium]
MKSNRRPLITAGLLVPAFFIFLFTFEPAFGADDCDPLPSCGGIPECMTANDCKAKTWPLTCPEENGWWQCCNGIERNERCCVPHCPDTKDAEADAETETNPSNNSSGGCATTTGNPEIIWAVMMLGLFSFLHRKPKA